MLGALSAVFLISLLATFQPIDLKDEGANLTRQWLLYQGFSPSYNAIWLSELLGGAWQQATDAWGLWGARLGWVLAMTLLGAVTFFMLAGELGPRWTAMGLALVAFMMALAGPFHLNYINIPLLLLFLGLACLLASQYHARSGLSQVAWALAAGAFLGLCAMARLPYLPCLALAFLIPLLRAFYERSWQPYRWRLAGWSVLSALTAIALCLVFLSARGGLGSYLGGVAGLAKVVQQGWQAPGGLRRGENAPPASQPPASPGPGPGPATLAAPLAAADPPDRPAVSSPLPSPGAGQAPAPADPRAVSQGDRPANAFVFLAELYFYNLCKMLGLGLKVLLLILGLHLALVVPYPSRRGAVLFLAAVVVVFLLWEAPPVAGMASLLVLGLERRRSLWGGGLTLVALAMVYYHSPYDMRYVFPSLLLGGVLLVEIWPATSFPVRLAFFFLALVYLLTHIIQAQIYYIFPTLCLLLSAIQAGLIIFFARVRPDLERSLVLIIFGLAAALVSFLGSSVGMKGAYLASWLLLPTGFLLLPLVLQKLWPTAGQGYLAGRALRMELTAVICAIIAAGMINGYFGKATSRLAQVQALAFLEHPRFRGITAPRPLAQALDELFAKLDKLGKPQERMLAYMDLPMVYYAARTLPSLADPWADRWGEGSLLSDLNGLAAKNIMPQVIVRAKPEGWPERRPWPAQGGIIDQWAAGHGFAVVWSNLYFSVLRKPVP